MSVDAFDVAVIGGGLHGLSVAQLVTKDMTRRDLAAFTPRHLNEGSAAA